MGIVGVCTGMQTAVSPMPIDVVVNVGIFVAVLVGVLVNAVAQSQSVAGSVRLKTEYMPAG
jgi:hypothetical protein